MTVQLKIMQNQHRYLSFDIESKYAKIRDFQNLLSMVFGHLPFLDPTSVCLQCESRTERMFWIPRDYKHSFNNPLSSRPLLEGPSSNNYTPISKQTTTFNFDTKFSFRNSKYSKTKKKQNKIPRKMGPYQS